MAIVTPHPRFRTRGAVLVIEDQQAMAHILQDLLDANGFSPVLLPAAGDPVPFAVAAAPDAIVLDVVMNGRDGWAVLRDLRACPELVDVPVVIASSLYTRPGMRALPKGGPIRFAPKPFETGALIDLLGELIQEQARRTG